MMTDAGLYAIVALASLIGVVVAAQVALRAWNGWLAFRHAELERRYGAAAPPPASARIELADLRERVRKLEAIAAGVDY